jgi:hypothetical protein
MVFYFRGKRLQDSIKADLKEKGYENGKWMELSWDHVPK